MARHPELATIIAKSIAVWANIEVDMAVLLGVLLKVPNNIDAAVEVFLTIRGGRGQREALLAAANVVLEPRYFELFKVILNIHGSIEKQRNDLVHGNWGFSDDVPDILLWVEAKDHAHFTVMMLNREKFTGTEHLEFTKKISFFRKKDLEMIFEEICTISKNLNDFRWLARQSLANDPQAEALYLQLCTQPHIQQALAQMRAKNVQPAPSQ